MKSASLDFVVCEREFSEALDARAQVAAKALEAVTGSLSFRLGRVLTAPARSVRSLVRRRPKSWEPLQFELALKHHILKVEGLCEIQAADARVELDAPVRGRDLMRAWK